MSDTGIFIFGMFVFAVAIGASLVATIGASHVPSNREEQKDYSGNSPAVPATQPQMD